MKNPRSVEPKSWDRTRLKAVLRDFAGQRILVIGDVGIDRYTIGDVERISPEAPVPIVAVTEERLKLGLAANVADNVQALGGVALLTGLVGKDRAADDLRELLKGVGVRSSDLLVDRSRRTILKERVVSDRQQLLRIDYENSHPVTATTRREILARIRRLIPKASAVILQDYAKGLIDDELAAGVFAIARRAGKFVAVDPNAKTPLATYRGATVLTPNTKEAESLAGRKIDGPVALREVGLRILRATAAEHVVITRGKEGMAVFSAGRRDVLNIPTYAREVYDVSGAGDTVISVLTMALAAGADIGEATVLGNLAAGVEVGKRGTATVTSGEIEMAMDFFEAMGV